MFGDSDLKACITLQLLCSTSSGSYPESFPHPKSLTGGQSLSSLAQQSSLQSEQRGDTSPYPDCKWYDEAYLQFEFTVTADLRLQCVVCAEVLANNSMKRLDIPNDYCNGTARSRKS